MGDTLYKILCLFKPRPRLKYGSLMVPPDNLTTTASWVRFWVDFVYVLYPRNFEPVDVAVKWSLNVPCQIREIEFQGQDIGWESTPT